MKPLLLCLAMCGSLRAETVRLSSSATFHGSSTLHDFTGTGIAAPCEADWAPTEDGGILGAKAVRFEVKALTTDHGKRDRNMMRMFEPDAHPVIVGSFENWTLGGEAETEHTLTLRIHGETLEVPVEITAFERTEDGIRFTAEFPLSLKACGLERPSVLGLIRVGDAVRVVVETELHPPEPSS